MISKRYSAFLLSTAIWMVAPALHAEVRLPNIFSDQMVLQQGTTLKVWGWAEPGERVTVTFRSQRVAVKTGETGEWLVKLKAEKAGGPETLSVSGKNQIVLQDVLVGEVWIASGQSNMEWPMTRSFESAADIAGSRNAMIRLFTVPKLKLNYPTNNVNGAWTACAPGSVSNFSAVAYYFARELQQALQVPVGVIHTSWGGSPAEVWMRHDFLSANANYKRDILDTYGERHRKYLELQTQWELERRAAEQEGKPFTRRAPPRDWRPAELYNGMIAPLIPYAIKGAIWYQGESNAGRAHQYRSLFTDMIRNWRDDWGQGSFTFLAVQLAPFDKGKKRKLEEITAQPVESDWAELREAQLLATKELKNVGLAVITDVGEKDDIHPPKKQPVGERLALAARGIAYKERIVYSGPGYRGLRTKLNRAILRFDHLGSGLEARGGALTGFAICGSDTNFVWGKAEIVGDTVVVTSPSVQKPVAVRYGWADYPVVNLFNKEGLPASPFRTDDFPMITAPRL